MRNVLIVTAATGAGHDSVAKSVSAALRQLGNGQLRVDVLDWRDSGGLSWMGRIGRLYGFTIVHFPFLWGLAYRLSDRDACWRAFRWLVGKLWGRRIHQVLRVRAPDVVLCVHPLSNQVIAEVLGRMKGASPFITVITDLAKAHAAWIAPEVSAYLAPTEEVRESLIARGVDSQRIRLTGLPIGERFWAGRPEPGEARRQLGMLEEPFTLMITGGGEEAGAILSAVQAISNARLPVQLLITCGRNGRLQRKLEGRSLSVTYQVRGFGDNMPEMMQAAEVVITKAGALTTGEAIVAGRPIIYLRPLPGQEMANARFACSNGLALMASGPSDLVRTIERWLAHPNEMRELVARAQDYRRQWSHAATRVAVAAMEMLGLAEHGRCTRHPRV